MMENYAPKQPVEGELHGEYKQWWSNGQLMEQTTYIEGKRHGEHKEWHYNGQLMEQTKYVEGEEIV